VVTVEWTVARILLFPGLFIALSAYAADGDLSPVAKVFDSQLSGVEREVVSLAEAMPADKFGFAPKAGEFNGVRTFAQQATHIASVNFEVAAAALGEANPVDMGENENGSANLKSKEQVVEYLKKSYAYAHKAMRMLTAENLMAPVQNAFGKNQVPRLSMVTVAQSHSFDHYGQMVVYARMCGIIPPASRPR
jgi:hypothetical protein